MLPNSSIDLIKTIVKKYTYYHLPRSSTSTYYFCYYKKIWPPDEVLSLRKSHFFVSGLKNMNGTYDLWYHRPFYNLPAVFFQLFFVPRLISTILCLNLLIMSSFRTRRFVSMVIDGWRVSAGTSLDPLSDCSDLCSHHYCLNCTWFFLTFTLNSFVFLTFISFLLWL